MLASAITVFAASVDFSLSPSTSSTVSTSKAKKLDNLPAAVTVTSISNVTGATSANGNFHITFRVRTEAGTYATNYYDYNGMTSPSTVNLSYLSGMGVINNYYKLYSSLDSGQGLSGVTVAGRWEP